MERVKDRALSHALVRAPGLSFAQAISSTQASIDTDLARAQHALYCQALTAAGLVVEPLPADERYPDSCFMQDPALVIAGQGIICRLAATSRQGEEAGAAQALAAAGWPLAHIQAPGTLEGGDVLILQDRVYVGQTARSNLDGIAQLAALLAPAGLTVTPIPVPAFLHLLSAVTYVGHNVVLAVDEYAGHPAFAGLDVIVAPPEEAYAVNTLALGQFVVMPAGYPRVAQGLGDRGFTVLSVPTTEFAKADGGVTCLSLVW
jgi:dimethylargininase